jgi:hypothetical protein
MVFRESLNTPVDYGIKAKIMDSNNFSCGIHFLKVLVKIHYSHISHGQFRITATGLYATSFIAIITGLLIGCIAIITGLLIDCLAIITGLLIGCIAIITGLLIGCIFINLLWP